MRRSGTIIKWNDEKGYGFITPDDRSDDVFLHSRALVGRNRPPAVGDKVFYHLGYEEGKGHRAERVVLRPAAASASHSTLPASPPAPPFMAPPRSSATPSAPAAPSRRSRSPKAPRTAPDSALMRAGGVVLILLLPANVLGALWLAATEGFIPPWVAILHLVMSSVAFMAYALDKLRAQGGKWRISESTLHLFEMAGGWPGAFAAQRLLRHKTQKLSFQVTYWIIVTGHLAFWSWFVANECGWLPR